MTAEEQGQRSWEADYRAATDVEIRAARAMAEFEAYDGCFDRIASWDALEQWDRDAHPGEFPEVDFGDAVWWIVRWRAGVAAVRAEVEAERDEDGTPSVHDVAAAHANYHSQPGNLMYERGCGWERCDFWDSVTSFLADYAAPLLPVSPAVEGAESE